MSDFRLFFALWPDAKQRNTIDQARQSLVYPRPARAVTTANLHLTLHFIGNTSETMMICMDQQARLINLPGFDLTLDHFGYFRKPKIIWLGLADTPAGLTQLHQQLGSNLSACGFQAEKRAFAPHVSLFRKANPEKPPALATTIQWQVNHFSMILSEPGPQGVRYRELQRYPLP